jgi:NitT/TauT family transport system substrate-binding protein
VTLNIITGGTWNPCSSFFCLIEAAFFCFIAVLKNHEKASNFIRKNTWEAAKIVAGLTQIVDPDFVLEAYKISPKYCAALTPEYVASTMDFVKVLRQLGYIPRPVAERELFDFQFTNKIHPEMPHYDVI